MKRKSPVKLESLIGTTINFLTLLEVAEPEYFKTNKGLTKRSMWKCKCICGVEKIISHGNITSGNIKSCGCKKIEVIKNKIQEYYNKKYSFPVERRLFSGYKNGVMGSKREFKLTFEYFCELVNSNCYYCNEKPFLKRGNKTKSKIKNLNGIDRIDSSKPYEIGNVVPCCVHCNRAKNTMSLENFRKWVIKLYAHFIK